MPSLLLIEPTNDWIWYVSGSKNKFFKISGGGGIGRRMNVDIRVQFSVRRVLRSNRIKSIGFRDTIVAGSNPALPTRQAAFSMRKQKPK